MIKKINIITSNMFIWYEKTPKKKIQQITHFKIAITFKIENN